MPMPQNTAEDFWKKIDYNGPVPQCTPELGQCWMWIGRKRRKGYGGFCINHKEITAHRFAYAFTFGTIPNGLHCLHYCDHPSCVNPSHLWLGTDEDNKSDMLKKGRQAHGERHMSKTKPESVARGERQGRHKLTEEIVRQIRKECIPDSSEYGFRPLGKKYGVAKTTIKGIFRLKSWRHVA